MYFCLRFHYQKGYVIIPLSDLIPSQVCACPKPGPEFPTSYVLVFVMFDQSTYSLSLDDLIVNTCGIAFVVVYHSSVEHKLKQPPLKPLVPVPNQDLNFQRHMSWSLSCLIS
jgi:hypothetical protein